MSSNSEVIVVANVPDIETEIGHSKHPPSPEYPLPLFCNNGELKWNGTEIITEGTTEMLTVSGPNLLNPATNITGKYISSNGNISNGDDAQYTDLIPVKAGETYMCSFISGRNTGTNRWHAYNASGGWVQQLEYVSASGQQGNKLVMATTIGSGISYVRLSYGINDTDAMIFSEIIMESIADKFYEGEMSASKGRLRASLTEIQSPYTSTSSNRGPATTYSVIPGRFYVVKNNVPPAVNMYTGFYENAEDVTDITKTIGGASGSSFVAPAGANYAVTTYLKQESGTTYTFDKPMVFEADSTDYKPYVAPQTASVPTLLSVGDVKDEVELIAGTYTHRCAACEYDGTQDVGDTYLSTTGGKDIGAIIVYLLATPYTEHITGQNLVTNEGTNIVDVTAEVNPVELKVKFS